jgi:hypothetical protein
MSIKKVNFNKDFFINLARECGVNSLHIEFLSRLKDKTLIVEGELLEKLIEVQDKFILLEEMDDDEFRGLYIEIPRPTPEEWGNCEEEIKNGEYKDITEYLEDWKSWNPKETLWYHLSVSKYMEFRIMKFTDLRHHYALIVNENRGNGEKSKWYKERITIIFGYISKLLDYIILNPDSFNEYVSKNLPYQQRKGKISRKELNRIQPKFKIELEDKENAIKALEASIQKQYDKVFENMTIRKFCKYYRIGHIAYQKHISKLFTEEKDTIDKNKEIDDIQYYKKQAFKHINENYDLDSEEDFMKFATDHYGELGLSRINVGATNYNLPGWAIYVSNSYSAWVRVAIDVATAIYKTGAPLHIFSADKLLKIIKEEDYVGIIPFTYHDYMNHHEEGTVLELPWEHELNYPENDEDSYLTKEQYNEIISLTKWEKIKKVRVKYIEQK